MRRCILIIEQDQQALAVLDTVLNDDSSIVVIERDARRGLDFLKSAPVDVLIADASMPGFNELDVLRQARELRPAVPVVVTAAGGSVALTVDAFRLGAADYLTKPLQAEQVVAALARVSARMQPQPSPGSTTSATDGRVANVMPPTVVAASPAMKQVVRQCEQVAHSSLPVLIVGELGVGKERVARMIHSLGSRTEEPFVKLNCEAMQEKRLVEICYGKERAAGDAGISPHRGLIEQAANGTLLLKNVTGLPRWMQKMLLRSAQEGRFLRQDGQELVPFRARIAASTRIDPAEGVKRGVIVDALRSYLNVTPITVPPLRDRREDIRPLVETLLQEASCDPSLSECRTALKFSEEALRLLEAYDWPGNIYELGNLIRRFCVFAVEPEVSAAQVAAILPSPPAHGGGDTITVPFVGDLKLIERAIVAEVINRAQGNKSAAARSLGLHRKTLYRIIESDSSARGRGASG
jgi:DNA-binding NtrC family response regulator